MIWQKREDFLPAVSVAYANTYRFEITREFPIEAIVLSLRWNPLTITGTTASYKPKTDCPGALFKRITLTVADGARTRNVVDLSGGGLYEYNKQLAGNMGYSETFFARKGATALSDVNFGYVWNLPIYFGLPNLSDPLSSLLLLPAPRYNSNLVLQVTMADTFKDAFLAGNADNAMTESMTLTVHVLRREVKDPNWLYFDTELAEQQWNLQANASGQMLELQVPGSYTGILFRGFGSASATAQFRGDPSASSDTLGSSSLVVGEYSLRILGNVVRRWTWQQCAEQNSVSFGQVDVTPSLVAAWDRIGSPASNYLDFLSDKPGQLADDFGSVLDTNPLMATGARLQFYADNRGALADRYLKIVTHRIFGVLDLGKKKPATA